MALKKRKKALLKTPLGTINDKKEKKRPWCTVCHILITFNEKAYIITLPGCKRQKEPWRSRKAV